MGVSLTWRASDMPETNYPPDVNAHLWRCSRSVSGRLNCGILIDAGGGIEEWAQRAIELLSREPAIALKATYLLTAELPRPSRGGIVFRWLNRWGSSLGSPLNRVELRLPEAVPLVPLGSGKEALAAADLDVLIWLESRPLDLDCEGLARLGVWYVCCGDPREIWSGSAVNTLALESDSGRGTIRRLAIFQVAARQGLRVTNDTVEPLSLAGPVLLRNLLDVLDRQSSFDSLQAKPAATHSVSAPGNFETLSFIARQALRSASHRLEAIGRKAEWFVAIRSNRDLFRSSQDRFVPQAFSAIPSPAGSQLADPMVVEDNGRNWLFVEEIPAGTAKGRLSVLELNGEGAAGHPVPILEQPYHLSYPFVFRDGPEFFMIPETSANNTIELYRATRFPFEWNLEKVLYSNVRAVDTTPLFLDGIWYFFTTSARLGQETFLFWSHRLDGEWHYHPRNPICSDVRRARGAGPLFHSQGTLIRPAQDCSVRYGYAIALNRVLSISPADYAEELIEVIYPKWRKGLLGTHTLSSNDAFEVIDGLRYL